jgi:hypothetical protein
LSGSFSGLTRVTCLSLTCLFLLANLHCSDARADQIDACVSSLKSNFEARQQFSQDGQITCNPADVVGFPPRIRTHNANATITYVAPDGRTIENRSVASINVRNVSAVNGSISGPVISPDGKSVSVDIQCRGAGMGQGRAWQHIQIVGATIRTSSESQQKEWILQCARCVSSKSCP